MGDRALLIVNADDFGISEGVNKGIIEAHRRGILTSTTAMANMPAFEHAVQLARENPELGVGVHLNLTSGTPLLPPSQIPRLVRPDGRFHTLSFVLRQLTLGQLDEGQIEAELSAQVERVMSVGISPTHVDSHHHVHMHPRLQPIAIRIARCYGIRALRSTVEMGLGEALSRVRMLVNAGADGGEITKTPMEANLEGRTPPVETPRHLYIKTVILSLLGAILRWRARRAGLAVPDHFRGLLLGLAFSTGGLSAALEQLPAGSTELMCHPGYPDQALRRQTSYADGRELELAALLDPTDRTVLQRVGIQLGTFADLYR